jgi:Zn-dependent protease
VPDSSSQGSLRLFRFSGIEVFLHWSWFVLAVYEIQMRDTGRYSSIKWNILEYLGLFSIVLLHEFGHALACRQVGGTANRIVLWPLGGVAYVDPPPRPGATLWSIAAGPLVNVALTPVILGLQYFNRHAGIYPTSDLSVLLGWILRINVGLFAFNILPIYPLDGGQILRALLWFVFGRARSLMIAVYVGFIGVIGFVGVAVWLHSVWLGALAAFMLLNCWSGLKHARALLTIAKLPRREGFLCPRCNSKPPLGDFWTCNQCHRAFDTFQTGAACPGCGTRFNMTRCLDCGWAYPMEQWSAANLMARNL